MLPREVGVITPVLQVRDLGHTPAAAQLKELAEWGLNPGGQGHAFLRVNSPQFGSANMCGAAVVW